MNSRSPIKAAKANLRDRFKEVVRETILQAAEEVFASDGIQTARMEAIATKAGVAVGTLYNHFQDRDALLNRLREERDQELMEALDKALASSEGKPFRQRLIIFMRAVYAHFETHRRFLTISIQQEYSWTRATHIAACPKPSDTMREMFERISQLVDAGVKAGVVRDEGREFFKSFLMGSLRSVLVRELVFGDPPSPVEERAERTADFFLHGAAAK
jgi:AcrR family transcriptional regulator